MLWSERKRLQDIEDRERAGESLWTNEIPESARRKIALVWEKTLSLAHYGQDDNFLEALTFIMRADGHGRFATRPNEFVGLSSSDHILDHIEGVRRAFDIAHIDSDIFEVVVNRTFNEHRVAFRFVGGEIVPLASDELHVEVVEPTLRLLVDPRFEGAHGAYLKALKEIQQNDGADAITDAATALQETLLALGCQGNALGPLLGDAKKRGLLVGHDQRLTDGISQFIHWASAERSATGDAHRHAAETDLADAWLMVHVVGALIVRLAGPQGRKRGPGS